MGNGAAQLGQGPGLHDSRPPAGRAAGGVRKPEIRCLVGAQWKGRRHRSNRRSQGNTYQPHVFSDGRGSVWVVAKTRKRAYQGGGRGQRGYWEYGLTRFEGGGWTKPIALPNSKGRSSTRINAVLTSSGGLALAWPTDDRVRTVSTIVRCGNRFSPGWFQRPRSRSVRRFGRPPRLRLWKRRRAMPPKQADLKVIRTYTAPVDGKPHHIVRGDFHRHTELSWDGGGTARTAACRISTAT